jgi:hypothetical protein
MTVISNMNNLFAIMPEREFTKDGKLPSDGHAIDDSGLFEFLSGVGSDDIREFMESVMESDIEASRPEGTPRRKASEDKFFGNAQTISDMELYALPHWGISPWNWTPFPEFDLPWQYPYYEPEWPFQPEDDIPPGWYVFGCWIDCPGVAYCEEEEFICTVTTPQYIGGIGITGSGVVQQNVTNPNEIIVTMHPDEPDFSRIEICVTTIPLEGQLKMELAAMMF